LAIGTVTGIDCAQSSLNSRSRKRPDLFSAFGGHGKNSGDDDDEPTVAYYRDADRAKPSKIEKPDLKKISHNALNDAGQQIIMAK
jgi:hypothetical protein